MTVRFKRPPSKAQAKLIAWLWGRGETVSIGTNYEEPTRKVCVARGWLAATGERGTYPNGDAYSVYAVSEFGLLALETYLMIERSKAA